MEVRILKREELPEAVKLAQGVFRYCLQQTVQFPEIFTYFEQYVNEENVGALVSQGRLILWGSYEEGHLIAVSGMQSEGHITMLYVLPIYQRRGYGKALLRGMRIYAREHLGLAAVTVNAMPSWTAQYFQRQGFRTVANAQQSRAAVFASLQAASIHEVRFARKPISAGWLIGTTVGSLAACLAVAVIYMVSYILAY